MTQFYQVFLVKFTLSLQDPDIPGERHHHTIFVQTAEDGSGTIHQVTGDVASQDGMYYFPAPTDDPVCSEEFHSSQKLGVTPSSTHPAQWNQVLGSLPAPPQQKAFNLSTMRTEPFKTKLPLTFYEPREPRKRLVKCTEWTMESAIPTLKENGLLIRQVDS
ncbi:hypothetical protein P170DRAFT_216394 [Aspergillus steynii IBT 23096]|uniref:Uncharacterized protein n=1 Tax=Aspergillus steynii IBT 23096 TaxID=1392250 RepID=A0A2I2G0T3_9EURO|nr:uncharacterized protein P170DRAFT_216394 [Aspergillus steynii IBT 23096]PLB46456.1 hypothetical protein P170DRAFT_216394 [Aspergillus steynii IBT 23096]